MVSQGVTSNGKPASSSSTIPSSQSSGTGARAALTRVSETTQVAVGRQRPWSEVMDRKAFDKPASLADAASRIAKNGKYFRMNYIIFLLVVVGVSLFGHPVALVVLALLVAAWVYLYFGRTEPLVAFNRTWSENQVVIVLGIATIGGLFLTKAGSTLTTALIIGIAAILLHSSLRRPDNLFLDEEENQASGGGYTNIPAGGRV